MNIQTLFCSECDKKTPHLEDLDETYLSCWRCLFCNNTQRPGGNSMVPASGPMIDDPGTGSGWPGKDNLG